MTIGSGIETGHLLTPGLLRCYNDGGSCISSGWFITMMPPQLNTDGSYITLSGDRQNVGIYWKRSTGAGEDDGYMQCYLDGTLEREWTGHDNDTRDWDLLWIGMIYTNELVFGGSYYLDNIRAMVTYYPAGYEFTKFFGYIAKITPTSGSSINQSRWWSVWIGSATCPIQRWVSRP